MADLRAHEEIQKACNEKVRSVRDSGNVVGIPNTQPQTLSSVPMNWPTPMAAKKASRRPVGGGLGFAAHGS